jgi:hypothetical protein
MKFLRFLDPEATKKLLAEHEDILTGIAEEDEKSYKQTCPQCNGSCRKLGDTKSLFQQGKVLPQFYLECLACGCEFNPRTGLIHKTGNLAKAIEPVIPIIKK